MERVRAARRAIDEGGTGVVLTARSRLRGWTPRHRRNDPKARAYAEAGADCLYAPRISTVEQVAAIVAAVSPKPVNLLINAPFIAVRDAANLGVLRISVGTLAHSVAWISSGRTGDRGGRHVLQFEHLPNVDDMFRHQIRR